MYAKKVGHDIIININYHVGMDKKYVTCNEIG